MPPRANETKLQKLERALEFARLDMTDILRKAKVGEVQFHETDTVVAVTTLSVSGPYRTCYVIAVAGDLSGVPEMAQRIEAFAKLHECQVVEMDGRAGWGKVYERVASGYSKVTTKYRKTVGG